jgi:hypothetical protein
VVDKSVGATPKIHRQIMGLADIDVLANVRSVSRLCENLTDGMIALLNRGGMWNKY